MKRICACVRKGAVEIVHDGMDRCEITFDTEIRLAKILCLNDERETISLMFDPDIVTYINDPEENS